MAKPPLSIPDSELDVLKVLWDRGQATVREVLETLRAAGHTGEKGQPWSYATVATLLDRLETKKVVESDRTDQAFTYRPDRLGPRGPAEAGREPGRQALPGRARPAGPPPAEVAPARPRARPSEVRALLEADERRAGRRSPEGRRAGRRSVATESVRSDRPDPTRRPDRSPIAGDGPLTPRLAPSSGSVPETRAWPRSRRFRPAHLVALVLVAPPVYKLAEWAWPAPGPEEGRRPGGRGRRRAVQPRVDRQRPAHLGRRPRAGLQRPVVRRVPQPGRARRRRPGRART